MNSPYICQMKSVYFVITLSLVLSCNLDSETENAKPNTDIFGNELNDDSKSSISLLDSSEIFIQEVLHKHFKRTLFINDDEQYSYNIFKEHLNGDTIIDAVITLNRLEYAKLKAEESGKPYKAKEIGYMGPFNVFFYYDGISNTLSSPLIVPSSPLLPLKVSFENITSIDFKDILIDFRIRNSSYKEVYFLVNKFPQLVFEWTNFDGLGSPQEEAYVFSFNNVKERNVKDIIVNEGKISSIPNNVDLFTYEPVIMKKNKKIKEFFFLESEGKYFTSKKP